MGGMRAVPRLQIVYPIDQCVYPGNRLTTTELLALQLTKVTEYLISTDHLVHEYLGAPLFADNITSLTAGLDKKLSDARNPQYGNSANILTEV